MEPLGFDQIGLDSSVATGESFKSNDECFICMLPGPNRHCALDYTALNLAAL
jgi:hypothetical protein